MVRVCPPSEIWENSNCKERPDVKMQRQKGRICGPVKAQGKRIWGVFENQEEVQCSWALMK